LRHGGLRDAESLGSLAETSGLHHREKNAQIPQPQPAADVIVPIEYFGQKLPLSSVKEIKHYRLYPAPHIAAIIRRASRSSADVGTEPRL